MPVASFDGPNKEVVILYAGANTPVTAGQIYSEWKEWFLAGNAQYVPAFLPNPFGGNPLGGGRAVGSYYFLNNLEGWHMHPEPTYSFEINIVGDLYPAETDTVTYPWISPTNAGESVVFTFDRSAATQTIVTTGTIQDIQNAVWDAPLASHKNGGSTGQRLGSLYPKSYGI